MTRKGVVPLQLEGEAPHVAAAGVEAEHPAVRCGNWRRLRAVQRHEPRGRLITVGVLHAVQQGIRCVQMNLHCAVLRHGFAQFAAQRLA